MTGTDPEHCKVCFGKFQAEGKCRSVLLILCLRYGFLVLMAVLGWFSPLTTSAAIGIETALQLEQPPPIEEAVAESDLVIDPSMTEK